MVEQSGNLPPRLPEHWGDQVRILSQDLEQRQAVAYAFYQEVTTTLVTSGIPIIDSAYRAKTNEGIITKLRRRLMYNRYKPIVDLYGARFIIPELQLDSAAQVILDHFGTPAEYPWGMVSKIDHRIPEVRSPYSSPDYMAVHVYVPFGGVGIRNIGEVQLFTPEWIQIAHLTRGDYERRQGRSPL